MDSYTDTHIGELVAAVFTYGALGFLMEMLAHALPLFSPIGAPSDPELEQEGVFYRNVSLYSVDSFFELFASLAKFWFAIVGL